MIGPSVQRFGHRLILYIYFSCHMFLFVEESYWYSLYVINLLILPILALHYFIQSWDRYLSSLMLSRCCLSHVSVANPAPSNLLLVFICCGDRRIF